MPGDNKIINLSKTTSAQQKLDKEVIDHKSTPLTGNAAAQLKGQKLLGSAATPNHKIFTLDSKYHAYVIDTKTGTVNELEDVIFGDSKNPCTRPQLQLDGNISFGHNKQIKTFDSKTGTLVKTQDLPLPKNLDKITDFAFITSRLLAISDEKNIYLIDINKKKLLKEISVTPQFQLELFQIDRIHVHSSRILILECKSVKCSDPVVLLTNIETGVTNLFQSYLVGSGATAHDITILSNGQVLLNYCPGQYFAAINLYQFNEKAMTLDLDQRLTNIDMGHQELLMYFPEEALLLTHSSKPSSINLWDTKPSPCQRITSTPFLSAETEAIRAQSYQVHNNDQLYLFSDANGQITYLSTVEATLGTIHYQRRQDYLNSMKTKLKDAVLSSIPCFNGDPTQIVVDYTLNPSTFFNPRLASSPKEDDAFIFGEKFRNLKTVIRDTMPQLLKSDDKKLVTRMKTRYLDILEKIATMRPQLSGEVAEAINEFKLNDSKKEKVSFKS